MEGLSSQERNVDVDKRNFIEAVSSIPINEIPTEFDESATERLTKSLEDTKLLILGEMHGVKENVDIIYTLFKKFNFRQLALEWDTNLKGVAERFVESGDLDFDAIKDSPDGRITAGHFALIKRLKEEGMLEKLVCFDGSGPTSWDERDANMAKNILSSLSEVLTLALAGNLHAKKEPITFDDESGEHHPMGERVEGKLPNVPFGEIKYLGGQFYNCGIRDFGGEKERQKYQKAKFVIENGLYKFVLPEAHVAVVPNTHTKTRK